MDRAHRFSTPRHDTRAWKAQVWISLLTAASLSGCATRTTRPSPSVREATDKTSFTATNWFGVRP